MINAINEISRAGYKEGGLSASKIWLREKPVPKSEPKVFIAQLCFEFDKSEQQDCCANHFLFDKSPRIDLNLLVQYCQYKFSVHLS